METFQLNGSYRFIHTPAGVANISGQLELASDRSFQGRVRDDIWGLDYSIRGHLLPQDKVNRLMLIEFSNWAGVGNFVFDLKNSSSSSLGRYKGRWGVIPNNIHFSSDPEIFNAYLNSFACWDRTEAEITLSKRK